MRKREQISSDILHDYAFDISLKLDTNIRYKIMDNIHSSLKKTVYIELYRQLWEYLYLIENNRGNS